MTKKALGLIAASMFVSLASLVSLAQGNLAGTWGFETSTAAIFKPDAFMFDYQSRVVIKQAQSEITVLTKSHLELHNKKTGEHKPVFDDDTVMTYFTDGRGETNKSASGAEIYSRTKWKDSKLITTYYSGPVDDKKSEKLGAVEIELGRDGQKLVITKKSMIDTSTSDSSLSPILQIGKDKLVAEVNNRKDTYKLVSR